MITNREKFSCRYDCIHCTPKNRYENETERTDEHNIKQLRRTYLHTPSYMALPFIVRTHIYYNAVDIPMSDFINKCRERA